MASKNERIYRKIGERGSGDRIIHVLTLIPKGKGYSGQIHKRPPRWCPTSRAIEAKRRQKLANRAG